MSGKGISFGNHGMNHVILANLTEREIETEITRSQEIIRKKTGIGPDLFAFPNGGKDDSNAIAETLLRKNGYIGACTLIKGYNDGESSCMRLKRFCVTEGMESNGFGRFSKALFAAALSGIFNPGSRYASRT
jgi:peptidoglycan/xylan/chitin deacetylase (PgdA/CDA1 family)